MGQYFRGIILDSENKPIISASSYDYNNGAKLMEHSYIDNSYVQVFEYQLFKNKAKLVWAGDYANGEGDKTNYNLYRMSKRVKQITRQDIPSYKDLCMKLADVWVINHTQRTYYKRPVFDKDEWIINPLPLLCAEGNDNNGGDYYNHYPDYELVGTWARNVIEVSTTEPKDYARIYPNFIEELVK